MIEGQKSSVCAPTLGRSYLDFPSHDANREFTIGVMHLEVSWLCRLQKNRERGQ